MHTFNETTAGVPAFLAKLWRLVEDPNTDKLIYWQSDGRSFVIQNQAQFARDLLPLNYKHNNMASFIRQLNMYGFHKITSIDNGGLKFDKDEMEFSHPCFQKDHSYLLEHIKRKIANPKPTAVAAAAVAHTFDDKTTIVPEIVSKVMHDVKQMRNRQESLDNRFSAMKQENEALWREVAILRQKHAKQQQIVNKLIQFLVTLVQPTRGGGGINNMSGVKRRFQLMINDVPESSKSKNGKDSTVPVIQELTEDLFDQVDYDYVDDDDSASPNVMSPAESHKTHDSAADEVASPMYQIHTGHTSFVDQPDSEDDEDMADHEQVNESSDNVSYIIDDITPANAVMSSPTSEWLESNIMSPEQIKQEDGSESLGIRSIHENYGRVHQRSHPYRSPSAHTSTRRSKVEATKATSLLSRKKSSSGLHLKISNNQYVRPEAAGQKPAASSSSITSQTATRPTTRSSTLGGKMISGLDQNRIVASTSYGKRIAPNVTQTATRPALAINKTSPPKVYTNKNDFISAEIPNELFDLQDSSGSTASATNTNHQHIGTTTVSPMLGDLSSTDYNPTLSEDYSKKLFAAGSSGTSSGGKNMAVTMYNKGNGKLSTADDVNLQLDTIQGDLDSLKELFKSDDYTLDANALLGGSSSGGIGGKNRLVLSPSVDSELFSKIFGDLDAPYGLSNDYPRCDEASGSELMTYQHPNFNTCQLTADDFLNTETLHHQGEDEDPEPDYLSHDLNTPNVERKSISFRSRND